MPVCLDVEGTRTDGVQAGKVSTCDDVDKGIRGLSPVGGEVVETRSGGTTVDTRVLLGMCPVG